MKGAKSTNLGLEFPVVAATKYHTLGSLGNRFPLPVKDGRHLRSGFLIRDNPFQCPSPVCGRSQKFLVSLVVPASLPLPLLSHGHLVFPFYKHTSVVYRWVFGNMEAFCSVSSDSDGKR